MGIFSSLFKLIGKIVSKLVKSVIKFIKKYWVILLVIAVIYFAPAIGAFLLSSGGPAWLSTAMSYVATNWTPTLLSLVSTIGTWGGSLSGAAWSALSQASLGTQVALVTGAAAMIAPEETADLLAEVATATVDIGTTVLGAGLAALGSGTKLLLGAGVLTAGYFLFLGGSDGEDQRMELRA